MKRLACSLLLFCCTGTVFGNLTGVRIGVDAGHGGTDSGTVNPTTGLREKDVNLTTALALRTYLAADGAAVVMTRIADETVTSDYRTSYLNAQGVHRVVSVHHNSVSDSTTNRTMDFVYCNYCSSTSADLATKVINRVAISTGIAKGPPAAASNTLCPSGTFSCGIAGVGQANLFMVRDTIAPATLVEVSFISSTTEEAKLRNGDYLDGNGWAIYAGIADHYGQTPKPRDGAPSRVIRLAGDLTFGDVAVGGTSTRTLTIYNDGNATLNVSGISYPSRFSGAWSGSIMPGESKAVSVTFAPSSATTYDGTITVSSDKTSGGNTIFCSGRGVSTPSTRIIRLAGNLSFGTVTVGQTATRQLTIHNDGNATLTVSSITYPSRFSGDWSGGTIGAGNSKVVNVTFAPTAGTAYNGTVTVNSDKTSGTNTVSCSGTGTVASQAVYDPVLKAPKCASVGSTCDSGSLLVGRAGLGPEPNAPNTIGNSCSDGTYGFYQSDESNERLSVVSVDGSPFAPGKSVRIEATVWAYDESDVLDIYYTTDVQNPSWLWIASFGIGGSGGQTLATIYTIPSGSALHAVRANFRYEGSPSSCTNGPYDDHDDLVFAVNSAPPGPQTGLYVLSPCRLIDTRNPVGAFGGPSIASGATRNFQVGGQCGIAADAIAVAVNVAVVSPAAGGYVTAYPGPINTQRPIAATINYATRRTLANNAVVKLGSDGTMNVYNVGADLNIVVDVTGYFK